MPAYVEQNVFGHTRSLPGWFWNGRTRMRCLAHAIGQSLEQAYAHHIQRLMVIGNFALLAGLDPVAVHRWYLGVYVDAFEWVELPNTVGMNQFADGGLFIAHHARFNLTTLAPEGSATLRARPCGSPFGFILIGKETTICVSLREAARPSTQRNPVLPIVKECVDNRDDPRRSKLKGPRKAPP
jgi:hypothetical protein